MSRLITFGCSFTYGQALPDCIESSAEWNKPSEWAWPNLLANKLKYKLENQSYPGSSNLEILYKILSFKFEPTDTVAVMWTSPIRDMYFKNFGKPYRRLGVWMKDSFAQKWIELLKEHDYTQRTWIYIHHADLYFKSLGVKYIHCPVDLYKNKPEHLNIENLYQECLKIVDRADDHAHPGMQSHFQASERIFNYINE